jgi:hypothetical protein
VAGAVTAAWVDATLRVAIIVTAFVAFVAVLLVRHKLNRRLRPGESLRMLGGGLLCLSVSTGTLGLLLGWETVWRLPFLALTVTWVAYGGIHEYIDLRRQ